MQNKTLQTVPEVNKTLLLAITMVALLSLTRPRVLL